MTDAADEVVARPHPRPAPPLPSADGAPHADAERALRTALDTLTTLKGRPVAEHPAVIESVHAALQAALTEPTD